MCFRAGDGLRFHRQTAVQTGGWFSGGGIRGVYCIDSWALGIGTGRSGSLVKGDAFSRAHGGLLRRGPSRKPRKLGGISEAGANAAVSETSCPVLSNERRTSQSDNSEWPTPKRPVGDAMRTHAGVQLKIHFDRCDEIWRLGVGYRMFSRTVPQGSSSCACALNDRARNNFRDFQSRAKEM